MVDIENLLDELKTVKEEDCLNRSYEGFTEINMVEEPTSIIKKYDHKLFHCDTCIVLTVELKKTYLSLKNLAKISEICYKYSDDVKINLKESKIIIKWKR